MGVSWSGRKKLKDIKLIIYPCTGTNILLIFVAPEINKVHVPWQIANKNLKIPALKKVI